MSIYGAQTVQTPRFDEVGRDYDALLVMSFGGPEGMADVIPFLENVTRARGVPRERLETVAQHYYHFGGVSPINAQNRALIAALKAEFAAFDLDLPIYFGNRNWHPYIADTVRQMHVDGVKRALVFVTSAFSSYSGCRQYREDLMRVCDELNITEADITFDKIRVFYNHPGFIMPMIENIREALVKLPAERRDEAALIFTAHSIPLTMAKHTSYVAQLEEASRLIAEGVGRPTYKLVYQSRSGSPHIPWLEPDIADYVRQIHAEGVCEAVVVPLGFISDHMEVLFDLDTEAAQLAADLGMTLIRAATVGTHPTFVTMIRQLIRERMTAEPVRLALGTRGPNHDICPLNCCLRS